MAKKSGETHLPSHHTKGSSSKPAMNVRFQPGFALTMANPNEANSTASEHNRAAKIVAYAPLVLGVIIGSVRPVSLTCRYSDG